MPFERNLAHLESLAAAVYFKFAPSIVGFSSTVASNQSPFQVLGYASLSRAMFSGMQKEYNMLKDERDEMKRAADRYREELHHRKKELKGASELLASCQKSLLIAEKEKEYAGWEADQIRADLKQARALI